ncbi:DUF11 domain-containing protein [Candidatus Gracilibacteria bacterium]|nr:DUF11 domain-containing protein [Candidatus Gracilibacteria bacterium]
MSGQAQNYEITEANRSGDDDTDSDMSSSHGYIEFAGTVLAPTPGLTGLAIAMPQREADERSFDIGLRQRTADGQIGDRVWEDADRDGIQDNGELGVRAVGVLLQWSNANALPQPTGVNWQATTASDGSYLFSGLPNGIYNVRFTLPTGYTVAPRNRGGNDARDSDADAATNFTTPDVALAGAVVSDRTLDFGLVGDTFDLSVGKSGPAQATLNETFNYTLHYAHSGNRSAASVVIEDLLPTGLAYVSATPAPSSRSGSTLRWNLGTLSSGQSGQITIRVRAPASQSEVSRDVTNTVTVRSSTSGETRSDNNRASVSTAIVRAEIAVTKSAPASVVVGDEFSYTLRYANSGAAPALDVTIQDRLASGLTFIRFSANPASACRYANRVVSCDLGTINAGFSGSISFVVRADVAVADSIGNTATMSSSSPGDDPGNNSSSTSTSLQRPDVGVTVTITPAPGAVGERNTVVLGYGNGLNTPPLGITRGIARNVVLVATLPAGGNYTLGAMPTGCVYNAGARTVSCALGDVSANQRGNRSFGSTWALATGSTSCR